MVMGQGGSNFERTKLDPGAKETGRTRLGIADSNIRIIPNPARLKQAGSGWVLGSLGVCVCLYIY